MCTLIPELCRIEQQQDIHHISQLNDVEKTNESEGKTAGPRLPHHPAGEASKAK